MPRARKPARLWLRPAGPDREAVWIILDGGKQYRTGCSETSVEAAQGALADHIAAQFIDAPKAKDRRASEVKVAEVLTHYVTQKGEASSRPKELASRVDALLVYWGDKTLDDITTATCREYAESRASPSLARRELEDLRAACRMAIADSVTRQAVIVTLPPKSQGRIKHFDRSMLAKLLWAAHRKREIQRGAPTKKKSMQHVARFILAATYTGSRSARVWQASFYPEPGRPYVDLDAGVFYRAAEGEVVAANKQAPPIRLPGGCWLTCADGIARVPATSWSIRRGRQTLSGPLQIW